MWEVVRPAWAAMSRKTGTGVVSLGAGDFFAMRAGGIFAGGPIGPNDEVWAESKPVRTPAKNNDTIVIWSARMQSDCSAGHGLSRMAEVRPHLQLSKFVVEQSEKSA